MNVNKNISFNHFFKICIVSAIVKCIYSFYEFTSVYHVSECVCKYGWWCLCGPVLSLGCQAGPLQGVGKLHVLDNLQKYFELKGMDMFE